MSRLFTILLSLISFTSFSQQSVSLRLEHKMGNENLVFDQEYTEDEAGYNFSITRLQYYISQISITHDGGQVTEVEDTWLLVNAGQAEDFDLGKHSITSVESISFFIGVDPNHNHLDPTLYPAGHPLAPQNPSMHWGWTAGYRFVCLEGKTGVNLFFTYEIHALGDNNYFETSVETAGIWEDEKLVIILDTDYMGMYSGIDVSSGLIEHGEFGDAITLLENFSESVFSQLLFTGIPEAHVKNDFAIYPNPSYNGSVTLRLKSGDNTTKQARVVDITGSLVYQSEINDLSPLAVAIGAPGIYFVQLLKAGEILSTQKLVIAQ